MDILSDLKFTPASYFERLSQNVLIICFEARQYDCLSFLFFFSLLHCDMLFFFVGTPNRKNYFIISLLNKEYDGGGIVERGEFISQNGKISVF